MSKRQLSADDLGELNERPIAASFLKVSLATVDRLIARGELPTVSVGRSKRISKAVLLAVASGLDPHEVVLSSQRRAREAAGC